MELLIEVFIWGHLAVGQGKVSPSKVEAALAWHGYGVSSYMVRKVFRQMKNLGFIRLNGNHYVIVADSSALHALLDNMSELDTIALEMVARDK